MRTIKKIDLIGQAILIVVFAIISLVRMDITFVVGYFVIGAWQVTSMILHVVYTWNPGHITRSYYHVFVFCLIVLASFSLLIPVLILVFYFLLYGTPLLAFFYAYICYVEVTHFEKRPLDLI